MPVTEEQRIKNRQFNREMTLHDRETNRMARREKISLPHSAKARELQSSDYEGVRISGYIAAGQIRAELLRRSGGE